MLPEPAIRVRGARTHNLQNVDLDLPYGKLIVLCGVSGSGKSSLAVETLYAEGQRRYIETFSPYARQFLERLPRPDVEEVEGLLPPLRIKEPGPTASRRLTVGTLTEVYDHLRLLFARVGEVECPDCRRPVRRDRIEDVIAILERLPEGTRVLIAFPASAQGGESPSLDELQSLGYRRVILGGRLVELGTGDERFRNGGGRGSSVEVVADRLVAGRTERMRLAESLEAAREQGGGRSLLYVEATGDVADLLQSLAAAPATLDGRAFFRALLSDEFVCKQCGRTFLQPDPQLFNFSSPVGACPECEGLGAVRQGDGSSKSAKTWRVCPACKGQRLRPEALAVRVAGESIAGMAARPVAELADRIAGWLAPDSPVPIPAPQLERMQQRLDVLGELRISHLPLARSVRSLSRGERQRASLARGLGSSLVSGLVILDEPATGLHPADLPALVDALRHLTDRGHTVLVVEHAGDVLRAADWLVELGPGAGGEGGRVVFQGTPAEIEKAPESATGAWLSGSRACASYDARRPAQQGWIRLVGASAKNLRDVTVEFPLGVLCVVTGVSGAGKTALVQQSLFAAVRERLEDKSPSSRTWDEVHGTGQLERVELVDQAPPVRTSRSNPVTYVKAFDPIRRVFAETIDAKARNYGPGFFSFNVPGGRCEHCKGEGRLTVDMRFLPDVSMACPVCHGRRYGREALRVLYRGRSIADVLDRTVREAIGLFRGQAAVQTRLQCLKDAGLDYLRLGQPANTLSGGEAQRLKLASFLQARRSGRTLYLLDEPTAGLHATDAPALLDCFGALLAVGHSLVVVSHSLQLIRAADYVIELGPGAGQLGGTLLACGTPEEIAAEHASITGRFL